MDRLLLVTKVLDNPAWLDNPALLDTQAWLDTQSWLDLAILMIASLVGVIMIYLACRYYYRGVSTSQRLELSLIPAGLLATLIFQQSAGWPGFSLTMIIVLSIIHFRSVIKDKTDALFVLWAILSGLFVGAGYPIQVLAADLVISLGGVLLAQQRSLRITYLLLIRYESRAAIPLLDVLRPLHGTVVSQADRNGLISMTIEIPLRFINLTLVDTINAIEGVQHAVMVNHEGNDPI